MDMYEGMSVLRFLITFEQVGGHCVHARSLLGVD
jgi:hypothetical protein